MSSQLIANNQPVSDLLNAVLIQWKSGEVILLRQDGINMPEFTELWMLKQSIIDIGYKLKSSYIENVAIIFIEMGKMIRLDAVDNRALLILDNNTEFQRYTGTFLPNPGDLIWTNETLTINNTSNPAPSIALLVDFKTL